MKSRMSSLSASKSFSNDLNHVFSFIENNLIPEYPSANIVSEYFIVASLEDTLCLAYKALHECLMSEATDAILEQYIYYLSSNPTPLLEEQTPRMSEAFNDYVLKANRERLKCKAQKLTSLHVIMSMLYNEGRIKDMFNGVGLTYEMFSQYVESLNENEENNDNNVEEVEGEVVKEKPVNNETKNDSKKNLPASTTFSYLPSRESKSKPVQASNRTSIQSLRRNAKKASVMDMYSVCLNDLAVKGKIDRMVGNEDVMNQIYNILSRRTKNNVIILGDGGVGKTTIAKNIAQMIVEGKCPVSFNKKKVYLANFPAMMNGANFKGIFEERFKCFMEEAKQQKNCIVIIDDIHSSFSDRNQEGVVNISTMISDWLSDSDIQFIATGTFKDYRNYIECEPSLSRMFQKVVIEEPSIDDTIEILESCKAYYETYHNVKYPEDAIRACALLSKKYVSGRKLPDSAIDLLDESGARTKLKVSESPEMNELKKQLDDIKAEKKHMLETEKLDGMMDLTAKENTLKLKYSLLEKNNRYSSEIRTVTENDIYELISEKTNIPVTKLSDSEKQSLKSINDVLKRSIIGQDDAIDRVCRVVKRNRIGISNQDKPVVIFLGGPTGVGKTLLAKQLAKEIFGDEKYLVRLDMSEYAEKSSITKLIGSAPGYIGYENGGQLTETIKKKKYCVLLMDEIEKANEEIYNAFLQMFDEGHMTDNTGERVDFKNVIILLTSNTGAKQVSDFGKGVGFVRNEADNTKSIISKELKKKFPPEFLNRIDDIVYFNKLNEDNMKGIIRLEIKKLDKRIEKIRYKLDGSVYKDRFVSWMYDKVKDKSEYGARPILRAIQDSMENKIIDFYLEHDENEETVLKDDFFLS